MPNNTVSTITISEPAQYDLIVVHNQKGEVIFKICYDGTIVFMIDGKIKEVKDEKEIATVFAIVCSEMSGVQFTNKEELLNRVVTNYRNGKIDKILN